MRAVDDVIAAVAESGINCRPIREAVALPKTHEMSPRGARAGISLCVGWPADDRQVHDFQPESERVQKRGASGAEVDESESPSVREMWGPKADGSYLSGRTRKVSRVVHGLPLIASAHVYYLAFITQGGRRVLRRITASGAVLQGRVFNGCESRRPAEHLGRTRAPCYGQRRPISYSFNA
jgi:hypothetical protein